MIPSSITLVCLLALAGPGSADEHRHFPGVASEWNGFVRHDSFIDGSNTIVVEPKTALPGRPWLWRGEFFGAFANADVALLKAGWHVAYIAVPDQFGSPRAMAQWDKFYQQLVHDHGLNPRPGLIGLSRGALYCLAWAVSHPDQTLAVNLDNGVCDFLNWPGGKHKGPGSPEEWAKLLKAFDFADDAQAVAYPQRPIEHLESMARAKIPVLLIYGDADHLVPYQENSEVVFHRYQALGGPVERIVKPGAAHHPHGLTDPQPVVDFFEKARVAATPR